MTEQELKNIYSEYQTKLIAFNKAQERMAKEGEVFLDLKMIDDVLKTAGQSIKAFNKYLKAAEEYLKKKKDTDPSRILKDIEKEAEALIKRH